MCIIILHTTHRNALQYVIGMHCYQSISLGQDMVIEDVMK